MAPDKRSETPTDARVAGAAAHWGFRFIANGTDYGDFTATLARITRWSDWCREWGVTATRYEQLAEAANDAGQAATAAGAWQRAALAWHWGKFVFTEDPVQQRAAHERTVACFRRAAPALTPPAELVSVPYGNHALAAYLRVPRQPSPKPSPGQAKAPVVIMVPGLDSTKEELQATAEFFLARGLATLAIDGPGQGEAEYELPIEPRYEKVATAAVDYLRGRDDIDGGRIGLFGVSLGGYYAARAAAYEPRLRAVVALAGPYRMDLGWDELPPQTRDTFQARSGAKNADEARAKAAELTLEEAAGHIATPLLIYPDGSHGVTNRAYESRSRMADWLAARLVT